MGGRNPATDRISQYNRTHKTGEYTQGTKNEDGEQGRKETTRSSLEVPPELERLAHPPHQAKAGRWHEIQGDAKVDSKDEAESPDEENWSKRKEE